MGYPRLRSSTLLIIIIIIISDDVLTKLIIDHVAVSNSYTSLKRVSYISLEKCLSERLLILDEEELQLITSSPIEK